MLINYLYCYSIIADIIFINGVCCASLDNEAISPPILSLKKGWGVGVGGNKGKRKRGRRDRGEGEQGGGELNRGRAHNRPLILRLSKASGGEDKEVAVEIKLTAKQRDN